MDRTSLENFIFCPNSAKKSVDTIYFDKVFLLLVFSSLRQNLSRWWKRFEMLLSGKILAFFSKNYASRWSLLIKFINKLFQDYLKIFITSTVMKSILVNLFGIVHSLGHDPLKLRKCRWKRDFCCKLSYFSDRKRERVSPNASSKCVPGYLQTLYYISPIERYCAALINARLIEQTLFVSPARRQRNGS